MTEESQRALSRRAYGHCMAKLTRCATCERTIDTLRSWEVKLSYGLWDIEVHPCCSLECWQAQMRLLAEREERPVDEEMRKLVEFLDRAGDERLIRCDVCGSEGNLFAELGVEVINLQGSARLGQPWFCWSHFDTCSESCLRSKLRELAESEARESCERCDGSGTVSVFSQQRLLPFINFGYQGYVSRACPRCHGCGSLARA